MTSVDAAAALASLADEYWERLLEDQPVYATSLGDRRFDDRLPDITPEGRARRVAWRDEFLERVRALSEDEPAEEARITRTALLVDLETDLAYLRCGLDEWTVDPLHGPQVWFLNIESFQPVRSVPEARAMVQRWRAMGPWVGDDIANLRRGLEEGKVAVRDGVLRVIEQLEDLNAKPVEEWPLLRPLEVGRDDWSEVDRAEFREGLTAAVRDSVRPAFLRYLDFLRTEVLPKARPQERAGISYTPGGLDIYRRLIRVYTALDFSPDELHETGLREVARINRETEELGEDVFGIRDRREILQKLRTDPSLYFTTRDEVAEKAGSALARAKAAIPKWFGRLPKADCEVVRMGEHEEKHSTIAHYRQPAADGSRPGRYYINTSAPETRPRYEAEALAYHESIPGHHLQIAIAQELEEIPKFRRHGGVTAFVEGWGLYVERLSDEMGLYSSDLDRIGVLSYDAWRACRLVVDTGMHAFGWTRQQAIDFMVENTALAKNNIANEVDRYITWPGQALAYKTGQLEILRLRAEAQRRLGARFDIRRFHDVVLGNGAVSLGTLRAAVERYLALAS
ncbi:MAG: DUF885 domain-containing protein [Euryarchaeota archaeon]|nr:DUF885 domain-containing protein [Euryarchaeota archaeon]